MNPRWRLSAAIAAAILWSGLEVTAQPVADLRAWPVEDQNVGPDLREIASRLELTAAGSGRWLDSLGVTGNPNPAERLIALTSTGRVIATRDGSESSVSLGLELDLQLLTPGSAFVLVHNHPGTPGSARTISATSPSRVSRPSLRSAATVASTWPREDATTTPTPSNGDSTNRYALNWGSDCGRRAGRAP